MHLLLSTFSPDAVEAFWIFSGIVIALVFIYSIHKKRFLLPDRHGRERLFTMMCDNESHEVFSSPRCYETYQFRYGTKIDGIEIHEHDFIRSGYLEITKLDRISRMVENVYFHITRDMYSVYYEFNVPVNLARYNLTIVVHGPQKVETVAIESLALNIEEKDVLLRRTLDRSEPEW